MSASNPSVGLQSFLTFGDLLKYLRRRARLTQRELSIAVGYSEAQISRLEQNLRPPDLATLAALFIPALYLEEEPETVARLMELAASARGESLPPNGSISFSRSVRHEITEVSALVEDVPPNNLPLQLTSFIGRESELLEIERLLNSNSGNQSRLVTLTCSGGCGKTRLALKSGERLLNRYPHGVWFIELAPLSDPAQIPQALITALGGPEPRDQPPMDTVLNYLGSKQFLLILDNCEHLVTRAGQIAEQILRACPGVQILATSREILDIPGEVLFRVPALTLPESNIPDLYSQEDDSANRQRISGRDLGTRIGDSIINILDRLRGIQ